MNLRGRAATGTVLGAMFLAAGANAAGVDGVTKYEGKVQRGGSAAARIAPGKFPGSDVRTVKVSWRFDDIRLRCGGERQTYAFPVEGGFEIDAHYYDPDERWGHHGEGGEGLQIRMSGGLDADGVAKGRLRVSGSGVPIKGGGSDRCDSGRLRWSAKPQD